jgi:hypothetical protein
MDMIRQSAIWVCLAEVSFQNPSENLHPCQEVHEDANSITTATNHEVELVKFEYPVIGHVYYDPIAVYMEGLLFSEYPLIPKVCRIVHCPRILCCEYKYGKQFMMLMQTLVLMLIKNSEKTKLLDRLLDWNHWHFSIT